VTSEFQKDQSASNTKRKPPRSSRLIAKWSRWLHIYISMVSFAVVLFFSVTGITLNHPTWFGGSTEAIREVHGTLNLEWVKLAEGSSNQPDSDSISRLEVVEHLRQVDGVRGALSEFTLDDYQVLVTFRAPAYAADIFVDRETGEYELVETSYGLIAMLNDLHKGRDSGEGWSWVIDFSAGLMTLVSLTGLFLIFFIKRHRTPGLCIALVGAVFVMALYIVAVPK
jgi:uncharacterized protein